MVEPLIKKISGAFLKDLSSAGFNTLRIGGI
jgi:hypothetical protein